jgi:endonuclease G
MIGIHKIPVPNRYYKIILDNHKNHEKMIGFIMENKESKMTLQKFVVSVDSVEKLTGIDFFPLLADSLETKLESSVFTEYWKWDN